MTKDKKAKLSRYYYCVLAGFIIMAISGGYLSWRMLNTSQGPSDNTLWGIALVFVVSGMVFVKSFRKYNSEIGKM